MCRSNKGRGWPRDRSDIHDHHRGSQRHYLPFAPEYYGFVAGTLRVLAVIGEVEVDSRQAYRDVVDSLRIGDVLAPPAGQPDELPIEIVLAMAMPEPGTESAADRALVFIEIASGNLERWYGNSSPSGTTLGRLCLEALQDLGGYPGGTAIDLARQSSMAPLSLHCR